MIGKVNLKIYDVNSKGGATMMVQKVSGEDFAHVNTLGMDIIKHLIDGVIEGKIEKKDIENHKRKEVKKLTEYVASIGVQKIKRTYVIIVTKLFNSARVERSPNSKKMRMDLTVHKDRNKEHRTEDIELPMDIDNVEDPKYLQKRNDEKILKKQKSIEQEEDRVKAMEIHDDDTEKKRKRQKSTEKKGKKKSNSERKNIVKNEEEEDACEKDTDISPGYMGWQLDEEEGVSNDRKLLAYQKIINDMRDNHKQLEKEVRELQKTSSAQRSDIVKLNKEVSSLKSEYKECVEALRKETGERTKAESSCKVLK